MPYYLLLTTYYLLLTTYYLLLTAYYLLLAPGRALTRCILYHGRRDRLRPAYGK